MSTPDPEAQDTSPPLPSFRPAKRQKFYRKREKSNDDGDDDDNGTNALPPTTEQTLDELIASAGAPPDTSTSVSDLLRQRKLQQRKRHGIEFGAAKPSSGSRDGTASTELTIRREEDVKKPHIPDQVVTRFAPQTGHAASVDRHMMAYIDANLSTRLDPTSALQKPTPSPHNNDEEQEQSDAPSASSSEDPDPKPPSTTTATRQPASLGKLLEIDVAPHPSHTPRAPKPPRKRRPRLGRDGKPLPERRRPRRASDDVKRDELVEALMRENALGLYDQQPNAGGASSSTSAQGGMMGSAGKSGQTVVGNDLEADERMAAEFKAEFMENLAKRQASHQGAANEKAKAKAAKAAGKGGKEEERLKGPKLGGSRSQRAVLRERELELQREREKKGRR